MIPQPGKNARGIFIRFTTDTHVELDGDLFFHCQTELNELIEKAREERGEHNESIKAIRNQLNVRRSANFFNAHADCFLRVLVHAQ
jgi:hypothetical protein